MSSLIELNSEDDSTLLALGETGYDIGMMSGTSLDALDAVICQFIDDKPILIATHSRAFEAELRQMLLALCQPNGSGTLSHRDGYELSELDFFGMASKDYGEFASMVVAELLQISKLTADDITAIGCHGQTVRHRPELGFSLQLIDPNILAERTGITVVTDFRRRDMAVGGQGAPLVPAFHQALFGSDKNTVILNLGGIANITVLADQTIGYDTGVANLLMDGWTLRHTGRSYDAHGSWARSGAVNFVLLDRLMQHPFLAVAPPKSTGREDFHLDWLDGILAQFDNHLDAVDVQATLCEFTALTASREIAKFTQATNQLYVCGGGAYNTHLLSRLAALLPNWQVLSTEAVGISPTWVEASAFAWLARQSMLMQSGNLPAVTGANKQVVLGVLCFG